MTERLMCKKQMFDEWGGLLDITKDENDHAIDQAFKALEAFELEMQRKGREILDEVTRENRVALLMIGRPYHNDPGQNHAVLEEFQALGYPILSMRSIPKDREYLDRIFAEDLRKKLVPHPMDVSDVWPENYSVNSVQKVWAAKFASRHPNVAVLDLSSFKCGHDAPTYGLIDSIIASAGKAYSALHDIDANKPSGSIKIRVKTYAHTLMLLKERLEDQAIKERQLTLTVTEKKVELMEQLRGRLAAAGRIDEKLDQQVAALRTEAEALRASLPKVAVAADHDENKKPAKPAKRSQALSVVRD
jgi:predicted nucleotide-binding protein (sugar kinase/HSP70/actin superfamily)